MATCKDCIHEKVCGYYAEFEDEADDCNHFKNKADVAEVKHGEWLWNWGCGYDESPYYCSLCIEGGSVYGGDNYCSNCGAKMDGGKAE